MNSRSLSRRDFIKASGVASLAAVMTNPTRAQNNGNRDKIRIGLIGAGSRGTHAGIADCAEADQEIELIAMADLFPDHLERAPDEIRRAMERRGLPFESIYKVAPERMFSGFNAYEQVIACDIDLVILTTPPVFRPLHLKAAVEAGKHVFAEKPVAVDPAGVRDFTATSRLAEKKGLTLVAGTQMRRARHIMAAVEQVQSGAIGPILAGQSSRIGGALTGFRPGEAIRQSHWSDMEWQLRRWLFTVWSSGDFLVEQHVHNLDLVDWLMGAHPVQAIGFGGRQARTDSIYPNVWDHLSVEYEYPDGTRITHLGTQMDGLSDRNDIRLVGEKGELYLDFRVARIKGEDPFEYSGPSVNPAVQQFRDTLGAIRSGVPINEGKRIAQSTMTAILGRIAAYTGRSVSWDWATNASKLDLTPASWDFGNLPLDPPAVPGRTSLV
jgi:predicted dehydrogenase